MQPKVSMVIPCYNKEKYIGGMFDSILAQQWDNIELILVNDGSTDGTREVIEGYLPKFRERGFEVMVVDQENQGVGAAVKNGLMKMTGEYICMPDCDDELDPEYVSVMAGWLRDHPKDQWVVCDSDRLNFDFSGMERPQTPMYDEYPYKILESFFLSRNSRTVWRLMTRIDYLRACRVIESFCTEFRKTQEPQVIIPLAMGGARPVYIRRILYKYFNRYSSTSSERKAKSDKAFDYEQKRWNLTEKIFGANNESNHYGRFLLDIGQVANGHYFLSRFPEYDEAVASKKLVEIIGRSGLNFGRLNNETVSQSGCEIALRYISDKLIGRENVTRKSISRIENGRLIAYAAFGHAAKRVETGLLNSDLCPDIYWDIKAGKEDFIKGIPVVCPDYDSLKIDDTILMLLFDNSIARAVTRQVEGAPQYGNIWYFNDILDYLVGYYYE